MFETTNQYIYFVIIYILFPGKISHLGSHHLPYLPIINVLSAWDHPIRVLHHDFTHTLVTEVLQF